MMLIDGQDEVYLIDRDNCIFKVNNITFPHNKDPNRHLRDTLMDGVCHYLLLTTFFVSF